MVPLGLDAENKLIMGEGGCKSPFAAINEIISPDISDFVLKNPVTNERMMEQVDHVRSLIQRNERVDNHIYYS